MQLVHFRAKSYVYENPSTEREKVLSHISILEIILYHVIRRKTSSQYDGLTLVHEFASGNSMR